MTKIDFNNKKTNFFQIAAFVRKHNLDHSNILEQAFQQEALMDDNKNLLFNFISSIKKKINIKSQLYQDIFASFVVGDKFDKTFFEFGATNGVDLSNSYTLETSLNWKGALSEPSPQWHEALKKNRKNSKIISKCIWKESGKKLDFFMSDQGELSTLKDYIESDKISMPGNTEVRKKSGKTIFVETISLNDVIKEYFDNICPSYISIDTEGSEYEILKSLNLKDFRPKLFTIEHNFTENESKIDEYLFNNNYVRIFKKLTAFDGWYIDSEIL